MSIILVQILGFYTHPLGDFDSGLIDCLTLCLLDFCSFQLVYSSTLCFFDSLNLTLYDWMIIRIFDKLTI